MIAILGQGIAGTTLAFRLYEREIPFKIFDDGYRSSSSMVAAGLWNPIVFRRINKSWMADEFIEELESFYPRLEKRLNGHFYKESPVHRIHGSKQERDKWFEKNSLSGFQPYLHKPSSEFALAICPQPEFGQGEVRHAGYLDLPNFLTSSRRYFLEMGFLIETDIGLAPSKKELKETAGQSIEKIIDCRGSKSAESPWWSYLPFGLTKGEVLTIRSSELKLDRTFNAGFFLLPLGDGLFKLGATFSWKDKTLQPTEAGKLELISKFEEYFSVDYEIVDHKAGVRPTVQDRRPLIGRHPAIPDLYIFNGLGTKGVMLAPYLSTAFVESIFDEKPVPAVMDIKRFEMYWGEERPQINYPAP